MDQIPHTIAITRRHRCRVHVLTDKAWFRPVMWRGNGGQPSALPGHPPCRTPHARAMDAAERVLITLPTGIIAAGVAWGPEDAPTRVVALHGEGCPHPCPATTRAALL